jgi:hypothetical protein
VGGDVGIGRVGHRTDHGDPVRAGADHLVDQVGGDPGDGDDGHVDRQGNRPHAVDADRLGQPALGPRDERGADAQVGGALGDQGAGGLGVARGAADDGVGSEETPHHRHRHVLGADVHAVGADGQRQVGAVVDQARGPGVAAPLGDGGGQAQVVAVGAGLQPDLERRRPGLEGGLGHAQGVDEHVQPADAGRRAAPGPAPLRHGAPRPAAGRAGSSR